MGIPFSDATYEAVKLGEAVAEKYKCNTIRPEHILIGLIKQGPNSAVRILISRGVALGALLRSLYLEAQRPGSGDAKHGAQSGSSYSDSALAAFEEARKLALETGDECVQSKHVLLAIVKKDKDVGQGILEEIFEISFRQLMEHDERLVEASSQETEYVPWRDYQFESDSRMYVRSFRLRNAVVSLVAMMLTIFCISLDVCWFLTVSHFARFYLGLEHSFGRVTEGSGWIGRWLIFVTVIMFSGLLVHWRSVRRVANKRTFALVAEEMFGIETFRENAEIEAVGRLDYTDTSVFTSVWRAVYRWASRALMLGVLVLLLCIWILTSKMWGLEVVWWTLGAIFMIWLSRKVRAATYTDSGSAFIFPQQTQRFQPRIVRAIHTGLSAVVGLALALPYFAFVAGLLTNLHGREPFVYQPLEWLVTRVEQASMIIFQAPALAAFGFVIIPSFISVLIYRLTRHMVTTDAVEWEPYADVPPVLYLRSWETDEIPMDLFPTDLRLIDRVSPPFRSNFTEFIARSVSGLASVVVIGKPGTIGQRGVGSLWASDDEWRKLVAEYSQRALVTVFSASDVQVGSGFDWEVEFIGSGLVTGRIIIVLPPEFNALQEMEPDGYLDRVARFPGFAGLLEAEPTSKTRFLARSTDGRWYCYDASNTDEHSYRVACLQMVADHRSKWDSAAASAAEFPSSENMQRSFLAEMTDMRVNPYTVYRVTGLIYPIIRPILNVALRIYNKRRSRDVKN